jgi:GNAT superfamily N-acetyltransferase
MQKTEIVIKQGLSDDAEARAAAEIFYEAFKLKVDRMELFPHSPEQALRLLVQGIRPEQVFAALYQGQVIGIAGIDDRNGHLTAVKWRVLAGEFSWLGASWRWLWLKLLHVFESREKDVLRVAAIAVAETARGQGVGAMLLARIFDYAREQGYPAVVLEVVDTNPARHLYERMGFTAVSTFHFGPFTRRIGFSAVTKMRKDL